MTTGAGMNQSAAAKAKADAEYKAKVEADQKRLADLERQFKEQEALNKLNRGEGRAGYIGMAQSEQEKKAGVLPPGFEGLRDPKTGQLLDQFKVDPFSGQASKQIREEALSEGPSKWAQAATQAQRFEESQARGRAGLQAQTAQSGAMSQLARMGGLGGGARTSLARQGMRDALMAQQGVGSQGIAARLGIGTQDMERRQNLLGTVADVERQGDLANLESLKQDLGARAEFDANRYNQQMSAWASKESADAQRAAAARADGGGKCFHADALIKMSDESLKKISEISVGDRVLVGGEVKEVRSYSDNVEGFELFNYYGTLLTGSHAVLEDGVWLRVEDARGAKQTGRFVDTVHALVCEHHILVSGDSIFSDDMETDEDFKDEARSLQALNEKHVAMGVG